MTVPDVQGAMSDGFSGIFVGGTLPWKVATGVTWAELSRELDVPCHVGRVGTPNRVGWAKRIGATSIDSCLPLWSERNLQRFISALGSQQLELL